MNKRSVLIILIGILVLAAGTAVWLILHPMMEARTESSQAYNDAWKLERIQGSWASEDEKYALDIDGYDYTLKIDGVYAVVASLRFDASEKLLEGSARFTLQTDPYSVIYPDGEGAELYGIDSLRYEDGVIHMRLCDAEGVEITPVGLFQIETSLQTSWPLN